MSSYAKPTGQVGCANFSDTADARAPVFREYQYKRSSPAQSSPSCMIYWTKYSAERALAYRVAR
ncbi:hypothetical protein P691DRAFT_803031 [Macrolepiota fuliginosa MF-IS2]|uniref:Uncharacterized protein n=1 Tax=Macrolepiota fuliginosa MF-IS2 TaxID=1400762 RepID=A0A9P5WZM8_9AGAR|nr:hypothetical protein P691DRAFT_803031 [Macrolepiota fuliginosa MF-IS2]